MAFNQGRAYHGSLAVEGGKLKGATGNTDYFFFICPKCEGDQTMRVMEYTARTPAPPVERTERKKPTRYFNLAFRLYCPVCQFEDFIKIDNDHPVGPLHPKES